MNSSVTKKISILLILLIACVGVGYFLTYGFYNKYTTSKSTFEATQQQNTKLNQTLSQIDSFTKSYQDRSQDAKTLTAALPAHTTDMANFTTSLGQLAQQSGVALAGFQVTEPVPGIQAVENQIQTISVSLSASGNYPAMKDFIHKIEQNLRLMDIKQIAVNTDENGIVQAQITLTTYYQK